MFHWLWISGIIVLGGGVLIYGFLHDHLRKKLTVSNNVLFVFAHPDDEVMAAGTIAQLTSSNKRVSAIYLTHGEDGPTSGICEKSELKQVRKEELQKVKSILGYHFMKVYHFPDRFLSKVEMKSILETLRNDLKEEYDTIISFDHTIGLYGHEDHIMAAKVALALAKQLEVPHVYQMTLSSGMKSIATLCSKTFKEQKIKMLLPKSTHYMRITKFAKIKKNVILAHRSQRVVMNDVQPYHGLLRPQLYYALFSKEYFSKIEVH